MSDLLLMVANLFNTDSDQTWIRRSPDQDQEAKMSTYTVVRVTLSKLLGFEV